MSRGDFCRLSGSQGYALVTDYSAREKPGPLFALNSEWPPRASWTDSARALCPRKLYQGVVQKFSRFCPQKPRVWELKNPAADKCRFMPMPRTAPLAMGFSKGKHIDYKAKAVGGAGGKDGHTATMGRGEVARCLLPPCGPNKGGSISGQQLRHRGDGVTLRSRRITFNTKGHMTAASLFAFCEKMSHVPKKFTGARVSLFISPWGPIAQLGPVGRLRVRLAYIGHNWPPIGGRLGAGRARLAHIFPIGTCRSPIGSPIGHNWRPIGCQLGAGRARLGPQPSGAEWGLSAELGLHPAAQARYKTQVITSKHFSYVYASVCLKEILSNCLLEAREAAQNKVKIFSSYF
ncbi:hypothetical protein GGX14DRAFT_607580 [Mycena pura]|uniref:Uncharacterized protein n=1 Tax=Mycena pura TaxID=153505 RepID=A0AAD6ULH7_9AGAR|nr:hypothetical protein GGX14DRAFT_607580 [Mycena pura]